MEKADRQISAVLHDAIVNVGEIVSGEIKLVRAELGEQIGKARYSATLIGAGVLLLVISVAFVLVAMMYALAQILPQWQAALIVALSAAVVAGMLLLWGVKALRAMRPLNKTALSVKESIEWAKHQMK